MPARINGNEYIHRPLFSRETGSRCMTAMSGAVFSGSAMTVHEIKINVTDNQRKQIMDYLQSKVGIHSLPFRPQRSIAARSSPRAKPRISLLTASGLTFRLDLL